MATFQSIVLIIAIVLLIICLIIIGVSLANSKKNQVWPPMIGQCPDYWIDLSGNPQCLNVCKLFYFFINLGFGFVFFFSFKSVKFIFCLFI